MKVPPAKAFSISSAKEKWRPSETACLWTITMRTNAFRLKVSWINALLLPSRKSTQSLNGSSDVGTVPIAWFFYLTFNVKSTLSFSSIINNLISNKTLNQINKNTFNLCFPFKNLNSSFIIQLTLSSLWDSFFPWFYVIAQGFSVVQCAPIRMILWERG